MAFYERIRQALAHIATVTGNPHVVTAAEIGLTGPMDYKGGITLPADFPTVALVGTGDTYTISASVIDNDATKTNTGQSFTTGQEIAWDGSAWVVMGSGIPQMVAENAAVDMVSLANYVITLPGLVGQNVRITELVIRCSAGAALNGDMAITLGNTVGGVEIMAAMVLTGLDTAGQTFRIPINGLAPAAPGNDVLSLGVTTADTGGGATGTITATVMAEVI